MTHAARALAMRGDTCRAAGDAFRARATGPARVVLGAPRSSWYRQAAGEYHAAADYYAAAGCLHAAYRAGRAALSADRDAMRAARLEVRPPV